MLKAIEHLDFPEEFRCRFINSTSEKEVLHSHEYFEIFLTLTQNITHYINGTQMKLPLGSLVFIRPQDTHIYVHKTTSYKFINFAFSKRIAESLFEFLGNDLIREEFLYSEISPSIQLSYQELIKVKNMFLNFNYIDNADLLKKRLTCKQLLVNLFTDYFACSVDKTLDASNEHVPYWLQQTMNTMKSLVHLQEGVPAMVRISGKSYEHLARTIKKYYNITLSEYITTLRVNYAQNMLINSNFSVGKICFDCGFNSQSWFIECFKSKHNMTPTQYRKNYRKKMLSK